MRILRALALTLVIGASLLGATPAAADTAPVTLTLTQRWNSGQQGSWTPYVASIRNDGAGDFVGDVTLRPVATVRGTPTQFWPDYRARVAVPHGSDRSVTFYVVEPPNGYQASLTDSSGRTVAGGVTVNALSDGAYAVAVLSDQPQAGSRVEALKPLAGAGGYNGPGGLRASRFGSAQDFPNNAVLLSGLNAVVIDDFDVSTLSDAQVRALRDFVGLGGSLVAAGGSGWRRTLLPLAQKGLAALNPSRTGETSLQPLADLAGIASSVTASIAEGDVVAGRTLVGAPGQAPLVVEAAYGAGRIIDLAYDPLVEPISTDEGGLDVAAWSLALDRAVLDTAPAGGRVVQPAAVGFPAGPYQSNVVAPGGSATAEEIVNILQDTPAAAVPPIGLLGALLVLYVMLAGPLNYLLVKSVGRRELMWVSVPAVALLFTSAAYVAGAAVHGASYFDNEVQLLRLGPDGVVEVHDFHGLYPPHRGDFGVDLPANTLASTALGASGNPGSPESAVVKVGGHPGVVLKDTPYGSYRSLQTLEIARSPQQPALSLESHLTVVKDHVVGTVRNSGERAVRQLMLVGGTGQQAVLAGDLEPRATVNINVPLTSAGQATPFPQTPTYGANAESSKREALLRVAAGVAVTGRQGDWALTGLTDPAGSLVVDGAHPAHSGLAALVEPVTLESVDSLGLAARPAVVMAGNKIPYHYDVYDLAVPAGYTGPVKIAYEVVPGGVAAQPVRSIEVYDWTAGTWRSLPNMSSSPNGHSLTVDLAPSETRGWVRLRVDEQESLAASNMRLVAS